jgi:hypothetical protein
MGGFSEQDKLALSHAWEVWRKQQGRGETWALAAPGEGLEEEEKRCTIHRRILGF